MDFFEKLMGFKEAGYEETRSLIQVDGRTLTSMVNGKKYDIGNLVLASLGELRHRTLKYEDSGLLKVSAINANVRHLHRAPENTGTLFQVASQFNMLEMMSPSITPEDGVARYEQDHTQGPACAIAAGAATIYRNYFAKVGSQVGQTKHLQLNGLEQVGIHLSQLLHVPVDDLWAMKNGYALCTKKGLDLINNYLKTASPLEKEQVRALLNIGIHLDVGVTDALSKRIHVTQAFCAALPVSYTSISPIYWEPFATLLLEAAYEATLRSGILNASKGVSNVIYLTMLGGGAFGNESEWIYTAIRHALQKVKNYKIDVRLISFGPPSQEMITIASEF